MLRNCCLVLLLIIYVTNMTRAQDNMEESTFSITIPFVSEEEQTKFYDMVGEEFEPSTPGDYTFMVRKITSLNAKSKSLAKMASNPVIECPANSLVSCADNISVSADNASAQFDCPTTDNNIITVSGPIIAGSPNCTGTTYTYTYTASDGCDGSSTCEQVFTISSSFLSINCPANITVATVADIPVPSVSDPIVSANCDIIPVVSILGPVFTCNPNGMGNTYTYTYRASSPCFPSLFVSCQRTITVAHMAPTITCPADVEITCEDDTTPAFTGTATGMSTCENDVITFTDASTQTADGTITDVQYSITRTWTITDESGAQATCDQIIKVTPTRDCLLDLGIPTMGQWALFILGLCLTSLAIIRIKNKAVV